MKHLVDTNVWLALTLSGHANHSRALEWLSAVEEPDSLLVCRSTQQSLLRLLSTAAVFQSYASRPLTNVEAQVALAQISADPRVSFSTEPPGVEAHWMRFAARSTSSPKVWMDAYLAAFAVAASARLVTTDTDFLTYEGLDVVVV
ncbi:TA system VapC family ribonuclease toxin [Nocardioides limicola]|uniref:TA system VapC family ribonuclease toxin n=1 Tax=Nocardioides limicola TaxID=2803368 RepID=UPI00193B0BA8|nr:TA system VapC family ribonuclease toxin [Nocardioides sp. DJM-14]